MCYETNLRKMVILTNNPNLKAIQHFNCKNLCKKLTQSVDSFNSVIMRIVMNYKVSINLGVNWEKSSFFVFSINPLNKRTSLKRPVNQKESNQLIC